jgi:hypothetical protein
MFDLNGNVKPAFSVIRSIYRLTVQIGAAVSNRSVKT